MDQGEGAGRQGQELTAPPARLVHAGPVSFRVRDDKPTFWDRVEAGRWEPETLAALAEVVGPGVTLLDLGAWIGPVTLVAAALGADVVAVEPDPAALAELRGNLAVNPDLAGRVRIVPGAVSPTPGRVRLGIRRKPGDSMSSALLADASVRFEADGLTPDDLAALLPGGGRLVAKIDVEGGEYDLLPALAPLLQRREAAILLSLHPAILAETGEADPTARAHSALASFAGWRFAVLTADGPVETAPDEAALERHDAWLLRPPARNH